MLEVTVGVELLLFLAVVVVFYKFAVPLLFPTVTGRAAIHIPGVDEEVARAAQQVSQPALFNAAGDQHRSAIRARRRPPTATGGGAEGGKL